LSMVGEFRRRLTAFSHARWWSLDKSWFPNLSDPVEHSDRPAENGQVAALRAAVDATEGDLDLLFQTIRADMDLLLLRSVGTQQESSERLHRQLAKVTALLLVPTLVGGIFGANTATPGGATWFGFELMIVLMIASSGVVYAVLRKDFH